MPNLADVPPELLERYLAKLFSVADTNGDGVLQPSEFKRLLELSGFNFSAATVAKLMDAADVNHDGVIEYEEFIPVALAMHEEMVRRKAAKASGAAGMPNLADVPPELLERYLAKLFSVADTNGDGVLQPTELSRLLELSGFNLTPQQVAEVIDNADVNHDGVISYEEFVPIAAEILQARAQAGAPAMPNLQDVPAPMLERYFKKLFAIADTNGDGVLQPHEFASLLELSGFSFTPSQIEDLMSQADVNRDGVIEYDEFIPVAMDILRARKEAGAAPMPRMQDVPPPMLERYFRKLFSIADTNRDGVLQPEEFKRLLELSGFNFSAVQIANLMDAADTNHDGVIQYEEFLPVALSLVNAQQTAVDSYISEQEEEAARQFLLKGQSQAVLERQMRKLFMFADRDSSGFLDFKEFRAVVTQMGVDLTQAQTDKLMRMIDVNRDGQINYEEFVPVAFELLVKVAAGTVQPQPMPTTPAPAPASTMSSPSSPGVSSDIASLEGRVLAVQSRRIIRSKIKDLYGRLDTDNDGRLMLSEIAATFGQSVAQRLKATLDPNNDGRVTQYEMRRFFDQECSQAVENGHPEHKYLEGIVDMLQSAC